MSWSLLPEASEQKTFLLFTHIVFLGSFYNGGCFAIWHWPLLWPKLLTILWWDTLYTARVFLYGFTDILTSCLTRVSNPDNPAWKEVCPTNQVIGRLRQTFYKDRVNIKMQINGLIIQERLMKSCVYLLRFMIITLSVLYTLNVYYIYISHLYHLNIK